MIGYLIAIVLNWGLGILAYIGIMKEMRSDPELFQINPQSFNRTKRRFRLCLWLGIVYLIGRVLWLWLEDWYFKWADRYL